MAIIERKKESHKCSITEDTQYGQVRVAVIGLELQAMLPNRHTLLEAKLPQKYQNWKLYQLLLENPIIF